MTKEITNSADIIDSRDVISRIEELEEVIEVNTEADVDSEDEKEELKLLKALAEEGEGSADWTHGETLIRESYFQEYAQELAEDIGAIPKDLQWPCDHIDWDAATKALKQDYSEVDFGGVTYLIRS